MTIRAFSRVLLFVLFVGWSATVHTQQASTPTAIRLMKSVRFLASDTCEGRAPGSQGIEKAADFIAGTFKRFNLEPAGVHGTYNDPFTMVTKAKLGPNNSTVINTKRERPGVPLERTPVSKLSWKLGVEYQPFGFSETGTATGRVVFAGYGLSPHGKGYDDYKNIDVKGAVVIVLRGLPPWAERDDTYKHLATIRTKATIARDKGAVALIIVNGRGDSADVLSPFGVDRLGKSAGILCVQVRRTPCAGVFPKSAPTLFEAEKEIDEKKKPRSFELPLTTADISVDVEYVQSTTRNIVGMIRGTDPALAGEFIVVGAHYDHLGLGDEHSLSGKKEPAIHYGADDNASGTAGLMELAERFSQSPTPRSIVFIAFSGEERGLEGSKHWVQSPTVPLDNVVAMFNMDMIGRLTNNKLNVHGVGTYMEWPAIVEDANKQAQFTISTTADGFGPSDHSSFTPKKIPVLFFFTGLHTDYHRPSDTWEKLDYDGQARILDVIENCIRAVGSRPTRPVFTDGAEKPKAQPTTGGFRVTLGVIPDYSDDPQGLRISGVREGTPADKAGMKADDIITRLGSTNIKNIYDLTAALGDKNPGDKVEVVVIRDGRSLTLNVTLAGR